jgi:hypothetical protein
MPLAVGLFGNWGSGKSFFMALLQERIDELAAGARSENHPHESPFCSRVRQIRFNAWHYVDCDLWASLAATLFEELARPEGIVAVARTLSDLDRARTEAQEATDNRQRLQHEVAELERGMRGATAAGGAARSTVEEIEHNDQLRGALARLAGTDDAQDRARDLAMVLGQLGTLSGALRAFWSEIAHGRRRTTVLAMAAAIAVATFVVVAAGLDGVARAVPFLATMTGALIPAVREATRRHAEARTARDAVLRRRHTDLATAVVDEQAKQEAVAEREQALDEVRGRGRRFQEFVHDRASSSDYLDRLGTISRLRRDFEQLSGLLGGDPAYVESAKALASVVEEAAGTERIVLYVDDLDRCPREKVVAVLQAVHLLMAFPLFVVVVGVDSRWLERSLRTHYSALLEDPGDYLEKIFQIPFRLRPMPAKHFRKLIEDLTSGQPSTKSQGPAPLRVPEQKPDTPPRGHSADPSPRTGTGGTPPGDGPTPAPVQGPTHHEAIHRDPGPRPEKLVLSRGERDLLGDLGPIIATPRAAKRLVNIYRMLRVGIPDDEEEQFGMLGDWGPHAVALLLGILIGCPRQAAQVLAEIDTAPADAIVWTVLNTNHAGLAEQLSALRERAPHLTVDRCHRWTATVSRFSFALPVAV